MSTTTDERVAGDVPARRRLGVAVAYGAVCVIWGSTYLGIRIALRSFSPFFLGGARFLGAGIVLLVASRLRSERTPTLLEWGGAALPGLLFFLVGNGLVNLAETSVSSGLVSVLVATIPLWGAVLAPFFGERPSHAESLGVLLGLAGVVVLNLGGELRSSPSGTAFGLLAPFGWALGSLASRRLPAPPGIMRTGAPMLIGGAAMLVVSVAAHEHGPTNVSVHSVVALVYLGIFGSLVAFSAFSYLLKHTRPAFAMSYAYVNPVIAVVLGVAFAGERPGATSVVGAAIVLAGVVVVARARAR